MSRRVRVLDPATLRGKHAMKSTTTQGRRVCLLLCVCAGVCVRAWARLRSGKPCGPCDPATPRPLRQRAADCYPGARWGHRKKAGYRCDDFALDSFRKPCRLSARRCLISSTCLHVHSLAPRLRLASEVVRSAGTSVETRPGGCRLPVACTSVHQQSARRVCSTLERTTRRDFLSLKGGPPRGPVHSQADHIFQIPCPEERSSDAT